MIARMKRISYFFVARYFRFFAAVRLARWAPKIILITGSSGKTTLLHLIEAQLGSQAKYSHNANSVYGISFDILGVPRKTFRLYEWIFLFIAAPFAAFKNAFPEKIYVVEADCDRPYEGKFVADFLRPSTVLWVSLSRTHSQNFKPEAGQSIEEAIAREFGYFAESATDMVVANADVPEIERELSRSRAGKVLALHAADYLESYRLTRDASEFKIKGESITIPALVPKETACAIMMTKQLIAALGVSFDPAFKNFKMPPSRGSVFEGIKNTTLIDSSYNASLGSMRVMLELFALYPAERKWIVLGDMLELGAYEKEEHEKLAGLIISLDPERVVLVGPRLRTHTLPILQKSSLSQDKIVQFDSPRSALDYLEKEIAGGEAILFKGARFLEGIVEHLLYTKSDRDRLCRRGPVWDERRKKWGL